MMKKIKTTHISKAMGTFSINDLSSPEARGKRTRFVREYLLSMGREGFCQGSNITVPSLKGWELGWGGGLSPPGAKKIVTRAKELNVYCTEAWLLHGIGQGAAYFTKDLEIHGEDEGHIAKELLLFRELPNSIDTVIKDDAMVPLLYPGTYVGGIILKNIDNAIEKECIIVADNDEILVRILKHGDRPGHYHLVCFNGRPLFVKKEITNTVIKFAAPIIWTRRAFREEQ